MADLIVDYEALTRSEESLRAIATALRGAEANQPRVPLEGPNAGAS